MKGLLFAFILLTGISLQAQPWTVKTNSPDCRYDGVAFATGGKVYYGLGITCSGSQDQQFYVFDPALNTWDTIAAFPGAPRRIAFAFAIGGKGYVGMGIAQNGNPLNDVWEYNPSGNTWTQKNNFPGSGRGASFSCATATKGYVGAGIAYMQFFADYYEYDPASDSWTGQPSFPGGIRFQGSSFAIGGACYALLGNDNNATPYSDCWKFDTLLNTWSACAGFPGPARAQASAFAINGKGYAGYGSHSDFYEYDPAGNTWTPVTANGDGAVIYDAAVATSTAGYCLSEYVNAPDCWEFIPLSSDISPGADAASLQIAPNPSSGIFTLTGMFIDEAAIVTITDVAGRMIAARKKNNSGSLVIDLGDQPAGIYLLTVHTGGYCVTRKLVVE